jgi:anaerobic ribonucleoside-triphosphate reductase activating protein
VQALRARSCLPILVYSGYTYERLRRMARTQQSIGAVLDAVEILVDGPYVAALTANAGLWTGSANQRIIDLPATRRTGRIVLWREPIAR